MSRSLSLFPPLPLLILLIFQGSAAPAYAGPLESGEQQYRQGNYGKAIEYFDQAIALQDKNARAHYLKANALVKISKNDEAIREYLEALRFDMHGPIGKYSNAAIDKLKAQAASEPKTQSIAPPSGDSGASGMAGKVSRQADETESRLNAEMETKLKEINREADRRIKNLQDEMSERIAANGEASYSYRIGYGMFKVYDPEPLNKVVRNEIEGNIQNIKTERDKRIDETTAYYKKRQGAYEDSAVLLDKTLENGTRNGVQLVPSGSSMYVRNYQTSDQPSGKPVPLRLPKAKSLPSSTTP